MHISPLEIEVTVDDFAAEHGLSARIFSTEKYMSAGVQNASGESRGNIELIGETLKGKGPLYWHVSERIYGTLLHRLAEKEGWSLTTMWNSTEQTEQECCYSFAREGRILGRIKMSDGKIIVGDHPALMLGIKLAELGINEYKLNPPAILSAPETRTGC